MCDSISHPSDHEPRLMEMKDLKDQHGRAENKFHHNIGSEVEQT